LPAWLLSPATDAIPVKTRERPGNLCRIHGSTLHCSVTCAPFSKSFLFFFLFMCRNETSSIKNFRKNNSSQTCRNNYTEERSVDVPRDSSN